MVPVPAAEACSWRTPAHSHLQEEHLDTDSTEQSLLPKSLPAEPRSAGRSSRRAPSSQQAGPSGTGTCPCCISNLPMPAPSGGQVAKLTPRLAPWHLHLCAQGQDRQNGGRARCAPSIPIGNTGLEAPASDPCRKRANVGNVSVGFTFCAWQAAPARLGGRLFWRHLQRHPSPAASSCGGRSSSPATRPCARVPSCPPGSGMAPLAPIHPPELCQGHPSQAPRGGQRTDGDAPGRVAALWGPRHPNPGEDAAVLGLPPVTRPQITKQQVLPVRWSFPARGAELPEQAYCYQVIILIIISPNPPRERSPLAGTLACFCILGNKKRFPHMHEPSKCIFSLVREHRHHGGKWPVNRFTAGSKSLPPSLRF